MIDALLGAVILVITTSALALLAEVSELAITPAARPLSSVEIKVVRATAKGLSLSQIDAELPAIAQWMADRRRQR